MASSSSPSIKTLLTHNLSPKPTTKLFPPTSKSTLTRTRFTKPISKTLRISCTRDKDNHKEALSDEILALEFKKLNTNAAQREEALHKSRELLFAEVCRFVGLKSGDDLKKKWRSMDDDEKWVLARGFVAGWSAHFHPLSARSVKEMVDEYLQALNDDEYPLGGVDSDSDSGGLFFPDLGKLLGFSRNSED